MKENILIIGVRRKCYKAAIKLGYNVFLWSDGPLHTSRKKQLKGWIETPYNACIDDLTTEVKDFLKSQSISKVIANSEETVLLGAKVRRLLGLKSLGTDIVERFHNKYTMKNSARKAKIPITKYKLIEDSSSPEELIEELGLPLVIKPVNESGAQDVIIAKNIDDVRKYMHVDLLAEAFVDGPEVSVETFVQDGKPIFHNITEYLHQWKKSAIPAKIDPELKEKVLDLNDRVIEHFGLDRGMTHAEFYLTKNGPVFGEIAVRPPGGYYMELIQRVYGFDTWKAYVQLSCGKDIPVPNNEPLGHGAVVMLHPGAGKVVSVEGEDEVRETLSEIMEFKIRRKTGDTISEHTNTSNEAGHILFWEQTRKDMMDSIKIVEDKVKFILEPSHFD